MRNALTGHSNAKAGSASSEGSACMVHHLIAEGRGGNLGHLSRPGSQDNVRVDRPEHKALFAYRKRLEVPDPFDGSELRSGALSYETGTSARLSPAAQRGPL